MEVLLYFKEGVAYTYVAKRVEQAKTFIRLLLYKMPSDQGPLVQSRGQGKFFN